MAVTMADITKSAQNEWSWYDGLQEGFDRI